MLQRIADVYGLGRVLDTRYPKHYSTTSRKLIVRTSQGNYFIKQKAVYASAHEDICFTNEFQNHLAARLAAVPAVLPTRDGSGYYGHAAQRFIVMPAVDAQVFVGRPGQVAAAADMLARLHTAAASFTGSRPGLPVKSSASEALSFLTLANSLPRAQNDPDRRSCMAALRRIVRDYDYLADSTCGSLVCHADYNPSNLLFRQDSMAAVIDFDNSAWFQRTRDVAEAAITFCGGINYRGSTSSLARPIATRLNLAHFELFMRHYSASAPQALTPAELETLPNQMALVWVELMGLGLVRGDFGFQDVLEALPFVGRLEAVRASLGGVLH